MTPDAIIPAGGTAAFILALLFDGRFLRLGRELEDMRAQRDAQAKRAERAEALLEKALNAGEQLVQATAPPASTTRRGADR